MSKTANSDTSCGGVRCEIKENLGLFLENGRVYNYFKSDAYPYVQKEDVTMQLAIIIKDVLI